MFHHNTIRKYTLGLLNFFNRLEIQYKNNDEEIITRNIPIHYKFREKLLLLDKSTTQILTGNTNVIPRAELELTGLSVNNERQSSKYNKINSMRFAKNLEYQYNSVSYDFTYELKILCRGMNEVCQIIEQIAPKFNPIIAIDIYDAENEKEPTRVPVKMDSIGFEVESYEEKSMNICTVTVGLTLSGYLFQPIKEYSIIKELKLNINTPHKEQEIITKEVVDSFTTNKYEIETYDTNKPILDALYLEPLNLVKNNNEIVVIFDTNSKEKPNIEFISNNCKITQNGTEKCTISKINENDTEFEISAILELNEIKTSIFKEFEF